MAPAGRERDSEFGGREGERFGVWGEGERERGGENTRFPALIFYF
jgi:hypothetical protein